MRESKCPLCDKPVNTIQKKPMKKQHRENLLKLARYLLSGDLEAEFDMEGWANE